MQKKLLTADSHDVKTIVMKYHYEKDLSISTYFGTRNEEDHRIMKMQLTFNTTGK